jgi:hypothetical protein
MSNKSNETQLINVQIKPILQQSPNPLTPEFKEPAKYGDYTRIENGENTLRILSDGIVGCEYWIEAFDQESGKMKNKPIRRPLEEATSLEVSEWSFFYAFFVWNYKAKKIQIFSTTKRGVIKGLRTLINNQKWGDVSTYDISITRTQTDPTDAKSVEYTVTPEPKAVLDPEIATKWEQLGVDRSSLFLLFEGLDPFTILREQEQAVKAN